MDRENLYREFSNEKIAIKVSTLTQIGVLSTFLNTDLYEDTSIIVAKLYHNAYDNWVNEGLSLVIAIYDNMCQVIAEERAITDGKKIVEYELFMEK